MWGTDTAGDCPDIRMPTVYSMMRYIVAVRIAGISGDRYASGGSVGTRRREVGAVLTPLRGRIEQIKPSAASGDPAGQAAAFAARRQWIEVPVGSIGGRDGGRGPGEDRPGPHRLPCRGTPCNSRHYKRTCWWTLSTRVPSRSNRNAGLMLLLPPEADRGHEAPEQYRNCNGIARRLRGSIRCAGL